MTSRGRAAGLARERRSGAPECEPCKKHTRLGVHMDIYVRACVCVLAGAAEGNCSQQDGAGYQLPRRRKCLCAAAQTESRAMLSPSFASAKAWESLASHNPVRQPGKSCVTVCKALKDPSCHQRRRPGQRVGGEPICPLPKAWGKE